MFHSYDWGFRGGRKIIDADPANSLFLLEGLSGEESFWYPAYPLTKVEANRGRKDSGSREPVTKDPVITIDLGDL